MKGREESVAKQTKTRQGMKLTSPSERMSSHVGHETSNHQAGFKGAFNPVPSPFPSEASYSDFSPIGECSGVGPSIRTSGRGSRTSRRSELERDPGGVRSGETGDCCLGSRSRDGTAEGWGERGPAEGIGRVVDGEGVAMLRI